MSGADCHRAYRTRAVVVSYSGGRGMISKDLLDILACPACESHPPVHLSDDGKWLVCKKCGRHYPIKNDIPVMLIDEAVIPYREDGAQNVPDEASDVPGVEG